MENPIEESFDGVFKFTNNSDEEFKFVWNSKEYTFPAKSTCPMIMPGFTLEEVQSIRKKAAYKYAQREFEKSPVGVKIAKEGAKHFSPATYNEQILEEFVQQCLVPMPLASAKTAEIKKVKTKFIENGTAIVPEGGSVESLSSATGEFKDYVPPQLGKMEG